MFTAPWNWSALVDESPNRYWLQIEVMDITGEIYYSDLRPFSVNGLAAKVSWTWKEFCVMGCQWSQLYYPIMWSIFAFLFTLILISHTSLRFYNNEFMVWFRNLKTTGSSSGHLSSLNIDFFSVELSKMYTIWSAMLLYLLYLVFFPWFSGYAVTQNNKMYLHYKGWSARYLANTSTVPFIGLPDVMIIVLPYLIFVVLPTFLIIAAIAANRAAYLRHRISWIAKKHHDHHKQGRSCMQHVWIFHCFRKFLILLCLPIAWKHWKHCRAIVRAYGANPFIDAPIYCFGVPVLLWLAIYRTSSVGD